MPALGLVSFTKKHRAALLLTALGLTLRLLQLNSRSLWFDEASTLYLSRLPFSQIIPNVSSQESNPPLHHLLMHFWTFFFSDPLFGLRLFSAICGTASLVVFIILCEKMAHQQSVFVGFLSATSSFWIHFSQDGRIYALLLLLALSESALLFSLKDRWKMVPGLAYGALAVAGLYTHNFFIFVLLTHVFYLAVHHRSRRAALFPWLFLYGAVLTLYSPWLLHLQKQIQQMPSNSVLVEPLTLRQLGYVTGTMVFDTSFLSFAHETWTLAVGFSVLALALTGLVPTRGGLTWRGDEDIAVFCLVQWAMPLLGLRLAELILHRALTQTRYVIFAAPFLYLWLALAASRLGPRAGLICKRVLAAVVLAGSACYFAGGLYVDPRLADLSESIRQDPDKRDPIVYLDPFYYLSMRHYYLPQRPHYLVGPRASIATWEAMSGYKPYLPDKNLVWLKRCVVVDPRHQLFPKRLGIASGQQVLQALSSKKQGSQ
jgi:uncharacterized membrane protein